MMSAAASAGEVTRRLILGEATPWALGAGLCATT